MDERMSSRDKEGVEKNSAAYPLRYVEEFFLASDAVAGKQVPSIRLSLRSFS